MSGKGIGTTPGFKGFGNPADTDESTASSGESSYSTDNDYKRRSCTVDDEGVSLTVERTHTFVGGKRGRGSKGFWERVTDLQSKPRNVRYRFEVVETGEVFETDKAMDADEAYWVWRKEQINLPSVKYRIFLSQFRRFYDSLCTAHRDDLSLDFTESREHERLVKGCQKCASDIMYSKDATFVPF